MNQTKFFHLFVIALVLSLGVTGCKRKPIGPTPIPGYSGNPKGGENTSGIDKGNAIPDANPGAGVAATPITGEGVPPVRGNLGDYNPDPSRFAANTVYFEFDRATIKPSETSKIDDVVSYLKANPTHAMQIEGHCDERGTEQYNLSLGERRALAVREYLVTAGISAARVFTISYGESRPAVSGHNEAAWSKNRRGAFVLLTPK